MQNGISAQSDTLQIRIAYKYLVAANMAFKEVKGLRITIINQNKELYISNQRISELKKANDKLLEADSLMKIKFKLKSEQFDNADIERIKAQQAIKKVKTDKLILGVTYPVAVAVAFLVGFVIAN